MEVLKIKGKNHKIARNGFIYHLKKSAYLQKVGKNSVENNKSLVNKILLACHLILLSIDIVYF